MNSGTEKSSWKKYLILAFFACVIAGFFLFDGQRYLSFDALKQNREMLLAYTQQHFWLMLTASFTVYTVSTAFSIPGGAILSLAVGFLFGRWTATILIVTAATLGATLVFIAARYIFSDFARSRANKYLQKFDEGFKENAFNYLLFLRLVPLFPFWLVNLVPAFTRVTIPTYIAATFIGIIPGSFILANLGQSLGRLQSAKQLLSTETILALLLLGVMALVPILFKKLKNRKTLQEH